MEPKLESAKNWDYLGSIHQVYMYLCEKQHDFIKSLYRLKDKNKSKSDFLSAIDSYKNMILDQFNSYLDSSEFKDDFPSSSITINDYDKIYLNQDINNEQAIEMFRILVIWSQRHGPFKLLNEVRDPNRALQYG